MALHDPALRALYDLKVSSLQTTLSCPYLLDGIDLCAM